MVENFGSGLNEDIRLLLVDDEDAFRRIIAKRLRKRGISPEEATNGEECLSILKKKPVDVVVLDVKMPGMNGMQVLRRVKERYPKTEVILLTGHASTRDGVEGIKLGAFDYLSKPIELEHLLSKIGQAHEKIQQEGNRLREAGFRAKMEQQMMATDTAVEGMKLGAFDYLLKPADFEDLAAKLEGARKRKDEQEERIRKAEARLLVRKSGGI
ncbi:MAG: response regulator [Deltaproteobacteria bacterium]|nr:response regulator [Deltaproteobacteria bacterium]